MHLRQRTQRFERSGHCAGPRLVRDDVQSSTGAVRVLDEARDRDLALGEVRRRPLPFPVVSDRGVAELGWA